MGNYTCEDSGISFNRKDCWNNVKDKLPPDGNYILLTDGNQYALGWFNHARKEFLQVNTWNDLSSSVTHWMTLPELPK